MRQNTPKTRSYEDFGVFCPARGIQFCSSVRNLERGLGGTFNVSTIRMPLIMNSGGFWHRHRWLLGTLLLIAAVVLLASFMSRGDTVPVRAATAQRMNIRSVVSTNGKVEPMQNFEAHAPVGTTVTHCSYKKGST